MDVTNSNSSIDASDSDSSMDASDLDSSMDSSVEDGVIWSNDEITVYDGAPGDGNCGYEGWPDYAQNNFVALPHLIYDSGAGCGMCAKMSYQGRETIVYATDRCPECTGDRSSAARHW